MASAEDSTSQTRIRFTIATALIDLRALLYADFSSGRIVGNGEITQAAGEQLANFRFAGDAPDSECAISRAIKRLISATLRIAANRFQ